MSIQSAVRSFRAIVFATAATSALAAMNLPKEGSYDYTSCWTGTGNAVALDKDHTATAYEMIGTVVSNIPGGLGENSSFRCVGLRTALKGRPGGGNVCEVIDPEGDKRVNRFEIQPDGKIVREMIGGTGKYEGMMMSNTVAMLPPMREAKPGTFQGCNRQTGTYKLK
jgi:hypothetical protein